MNLDLTFVTEEHSMQSDPPQAARLHGIRRMEATFEAPDGQQYKALVLDADDSYDMVVVSPNGEREIVWSLLKEEPDSETLTITEENCDVCREPIWSDGSCSAQCPNNGRHQVEAA